MLKHLSRVFIQFTPGDGRAASARELLRRVTSNSARKSNPACVVDFKIDLDGQPGKAYVDMVFTDKEERRVYTADHNVQTIADMIERKACEMEMRSVLQEVGYDPWKPENRLTSTVAMVAAPVGPAASLRKEELLYKKGV